jgi:hypothetical protein
MKTAFTICLWPMALIGVGLIGAIVCGLVRAGWRIGMDLLDWIQRK